MSNVMKCAGGVIEEIGPKVSRGWKKGDRIATFVHGGNDSRQGDGMSEITIRLSTICALGV